MAVSHFRCTFLSGCIIALIQNTASRLSVTREVLQNTCRFIHLLKWWWIYILQQCPMAKTEIWSPIMSGALHIKKTQFLSPDALLELKCCGYVTLHLNHSWLSLLLQTTQWLQSNALPIHLCGLLVPQYFLMCFSLWGKAVLPAQVTDGKLSPKDTIFQMCIFQFNLLFKTN